MNRTYEEIIDSMKNAYYNECKALPEESSGTMKIFEILASELFSLSCTGDYILRQAFVQTATGEHLDRLGELRGCERKTPSFAQGILTFSIAEASEESIIIPSGTICSVYDKPYMQYATQERGIINPGELSVSVNACALTMGDIYNADAGTVTVMVNAPVGVTAVTNPQDFKGGYDGENDELYRERILCHYKEDLNGENLGSYESIILSLDYVTDCHIPPADEKGIVNIYVSTKNDSLSDEQIYEISKTVYAAYVAGIEINIFLAQQKDFDLTVEATVLSGFDREKIRQEIESRVLSITGAAKIGKAISYNSLYRSLLDIDGVTEFAVYCPQSSLSDIYCGNNEILHLRNLTVVC